MSNEDIIIGLSTTDSVIKTEFTFHGHCLRQVWRKNDVAIYERSLSKDRPVHEFELIIIQIGRAHV